MTETDLIDAAFPRRDIGVIKGGQGSTQHSNRKTQSSPRNWHSAVQVVKRTSATCDWGKIRRACCACRIRPQSMHGTRTRRRSRTRTEGSWAASGSRGSSSTPRSSVTSASSAFRILIRAIRATVGICGSATGPAVHRLCGPRSLRSRTERPGSAARPVASTARRRRAAKSSVAQ